MINPRIERLLWRCEYGKLAPELLEIELRAALDTLGDTTLDLLEHATTIRLWNPDLLEARTSAFNAAVRAIDMMRYREALRQIRCCEHAMKSIHELIEAVAATDRADEAAMALYDLAATVRLQRLPSVASLAQIVDAARQTIVEGQYVRAVHMANVCSRMAACLREWRRVTSAEVDETRNRISAIDELCAATRQFAASTEVDPTHDRTLDVLRRLLGDHYPQLSFRLLTELEIDLAGRRRFWLLYQRRAASALTFGSDEEVRSVVSERSWDGAVDHYWHLSIAAHAGAMQLQRRRIDAAVAELDASIQPELVHSA